MALRFLICGCGRSGTGFLSEVVRQSGNRCGHERVFNVFGPFLRDDLVYESSWYAVPYIDQLPKDVRVLHVTRNPEDVMRSFFRIGLLADNPIHHISSGHTWKFLRSAFSKPSMAMWRVRFVKRHRVYLKEHTNCFSLGDEVKRLETYWREWNIMAEEKAARANLQYLRVKLEDTVRDTGLVRDFLELGDFEPELKATNRKLEYKGRHYRPLDFDQETLHLMERYEYL